MERFSSDDIPASDRVAVINEVVARHIAGRRFVPVDNVELRVSIMAFALPDRITVGSGTYSPVIGSRSRDLLDDGRDDYLLTIHTSDHEVSIDGGAPIAVPAGDLMIISESQCSRFRLPSTDVKAISLGRDRLRRLAPRIELEPFHHIAATAQGVSLIAGYADLLRQNPPPGAKASVVAANHLYDLAGLLLDDLVEGGAARNLSGIRAARLELVKKDILDRLLDPCLRIEAVAKRQGITPRYIQQLFASEGTAFSEFLRESRLDLVFRMLSETPPAQGNISDIAFDSGFLDLSTFNRGFRQRFGMAPSEVRANAMRRRGG